ncbi:uncharacterized protein L969DRAFT_105564 [Mixia osmundae IAM 14324]|uniref:tRNA (uracil-O(2)-)-methyltransferase n=1 Tax=Mixia osmundae (strain CBS 9802 / IAM 14324 / JCM 22182 / KY 12970) TaxID=764103 RepID=G7E2D8_MIXOS|nr:uncharacterized protein L969DRAFT_105564 [Mixia osmundae IAM 14324]KEI36869.1 hypothetical protein L969DRAFT_105564 [Mixia osmundae IAM 14324]GAA96998.1 hypothetical protein E5Q_03672 [Mixia osmundae IAM 14324]
MLKVPASSLGAEWVALCSIEARFSAGSFVRAAVDSCYSYPSDHGAATFDIVSDDSGPFEAHATRHDPTLQDFRCTRRIERVLHSPDTPIEQTYLFYIARVPSKPHDIALLVGTSYPGSCKRYTAFRMSQADSRLELLEAVPTTNDGTDDRKQIDEARKTAEMLLADLDRRARVLPEPSHSPFTICSANVEALCERLKDKHAWIIDAFPKRELAVKHLQEDAGLAAYTICLFDKLYGPGGQPEGGFVDIGCGSGLLVHILTQAGYRGFGLDAQRDTHWDLWQSFDGTSADLRQIELNLCSQFTCAAEELPAGAHLIGNHADKLTPWLPLLAAKSHASGFINVPCCPHTLDGSFIAQVHRMPASIPARMLYGYGKQGGMRLKASRSEAYQDYLCDLAWQCGWVSMRVTMPISALRNVALIGLSRTWHDAQLDNVDQVTQKLQ